MGAKGGHTHSIPWNSAATERWLVVCTHCVSTLYTFALYRDRFTAKLDPFVAHVWVCAALPLLGPGQSLAGAIRTRVQLLLIAVTIDLGASPADNRTTGYCKLEKFASCSGRCLVASAWAVWSLSWGCLARSRLPALWQRYLLAQTRSTLFSCSNVSAVLEAMYIEFP